MKKSNLIILIVSIFLLIFLIFILIIAINKYVIINNGTLLKNLKKISDIQAEVTDYTIFGRSLNLAGNIPLNEEVYNLSNCSAEFIMVDSKGKESNIDFNYYIEDNNLFFKTSNYINDGIILDNILVGNYKLFIKVTDTVTCLPIYYCLKNSTEYGNENYYTITKDNSNNFIKILWENETLCLNVSKSSLPYNVYDIVIDQGHGGKSTGAIANGYIESEVNYKCGIMLKEKLEALGLKVYVTRTDINQTTPDYGKNGRAVAANKYKAKYSISIHNNASNYVENCGVEIYCPAKCNLTFGKSLADNIVNIAGSSYSPNPVGKVSDGVYVLKFDEETILECEKEAIEAGYEPYKITTDTMLFFMIREVGGILTGAYIDGRAPNTESNPYRNSNHVAEGYLLELGYVTNKNDIDNVYYCAENYIDAIVKSVKENLSL